MMKLISVLFLFVLIVFCSGQATQAGNNSGQAFSLWPDTGQTICYNADGNVLNPCPSEGQPFFGQDAQYNGPARFYTKLDASGNDLPESAASWSMVRDNVTGLIWETKNTKDSAQDFGNPHDADNTYTWCDTNPDTNGGDPGSCGINNTEDFLTALNGSAFGGQTDWRLPTIKELKTLVDRSQYNPAISTIFFSDSAYSPDIISFFYWSATTNVGYGLPVVAWLNGFNRGWDGIEGKVSSYYVRAVRGGARSSLLVDNHDGTVTDAVTCLQWQQATADVNEDGYIDKVSWESALAYAENLSLAGYDDWRLPDYNELSSIVDYSRYAPAIDITAFPGTVSEDYWNSGYWSSTTYAYETDFAWYVDFYYGIGREFPKYTSGNPGQYVRAVRGGPCGSLGYSTITATAGGNGSLDSGTPSPQTVANGSATQFTFNANTGYHVAGLTGCGVNYSNTSNAVTSYTATTGIITVDCTVSATFAINRYTVNSSVSGGNGTIAPTGNQVVNYGATPSFTLTPATGYHVAGVSGTCGGTQIGNTFTTNPVTANCTVVTSFVMNQYTVSASAGANGSLDSSTPSPQTVVYGATTQFTFNANTGYHVAGITGCGVNYSNTSNAVLSYTATTGVITGDCTVSATFAINQYTLLSSNGANGMISPLGAVMVNHGSNQGYTITPNTNYQVADVLVDGGSVGAVTSYQFTNVTANHSISASFTINTYTVNSSVSGGNGSIAPVGDQIVNYGATPSFTLTPATDYHVYQVMGTCGGTLDGTTFTANPVTANCSVIASFSLTTYTVTSSVLGGNGIIAPEGAQTVNINDTLSFTLTPATGYHIDQVISTCGGALSGNIFTTNPVTASCTVMGTFAINSYTLHVNFAGQGSGTVISTPAGIDSCTSDCIADFQYGQEVVLKASADEGSKFTGWSREGCSGTGDCTVVMDQAREITATFVPNKFPWPMFMPAIQNQSQQ